MVNKSEAIGPVPGILQPVIAGWLADQAGIDRASAQCGAVTLIHRFGSALNQRTRIGTRIGTSTLAGPNPGAGPRSRPRSRPRIVESENSAEHAAGRGRLTTGVSGIDCGGKLPWISGP